MKPTSITPTKQATEIIAALGGVAEAARLLGVKHSSICGWKRRNRIPASRVRAVSFATGIPAHQLRSDIFGDGHGGPLHASENE